MNPQIEPRLTSIIIPTFNGAARIGTCLEALLAQSGQHRTEILVVNDGSADNTAEVVRAYSNVRLINQANAGPAAARNRGAGAASGEFILFTDDDCVPSPEWLGAMLRPFGDLEVVGAKGAYRTRQKSIVARFVQIEYEDRYLKMKRFRDIDFVDTYSAGFRRNSFLEMAGYDKAFPIACAEDAELSYRMSRRGWKMRFVPEAVVYHTHPANLVDYLKKKYKFAFWRVHAVRKNPGKAVQDSHTPQVMKLQLLFAPAFLVSVIFDVAQHTSGWLSLAVFAAFLISALPFAVRAFAKDPVVGLLSPLLLAARSCAQCVGVAAGLLNTSRNPVGVRTDSAAGN